LGYANIKPILARLILLQNIQDDNNSICWRTNMADSKAGMFDVAKRCIEILSINFKLLTGLTYLRSAILDLATEHNTSIKARNPIISFFKTKQQEFIHPLILSPTHAKKHKIDEKSKKIEFVFHLVLLGQNELSRIDHFIKA